MNQFNSYIPTRIMFGPGQLKNLAACELPGKRALICVTSDGLMEKLGIQQQVIALLKQNGTDAVVFDQIQPNPTVAGVEAAAALAAEKGCDFFIGLGGGSSMDTAKAAAILARNGGHLWEYASAGTGGRKPVTDAAPMVCITTTCGTGTEADPYCVITNEETHEKLDFALDAIFPTLSIIDPELMCTLPHDLTLWQGFDALFHACECYVTNGHKNPLLDLYAREAVETISKNLCRVLENGSDLEARTAMAYAADILCGYTQALDSTTSHHIIGQTMGGEFPAVPHGVTLILIAKEYYKHVSHYFPELFDDLGEMMGEARSEENPGTGFVRALEKLLARTGADQIRMTDYQITIEGLVNIARTAVEKVGLSCDRYEPALTTEDVLAILLKSYR